jgi:hypothetical protein
MGDEYLSVFQQKLAESRAKKTQVPAEPIAGTQQIPEQLAGVGLEDTDDLIYEPDGLDDVIDNISILDAYDKFVGKRRKNPRPGQTESIKVICPWHDEKDPSAWVNTDKNLITCGHDMSIGGDVLTLASMYFGLDLQSKKDFPRLRKLTAEAFGQVIIRKVGNREVVTPIVSHPAEEPRKPLQLVAPPANEDNVIQIIQAANEDELANNIIYPTLDWRQLITENTFLDTYMQCATIDSSPEEYHFFNALLALGLCAQRDIYLLDYKPVYGNLFICLLGHTGNMKSTATDPLFALIRKAFPYEEDDDKTRGIQLVPQVGSGESLVHHFQKEVFDPNFMPVPGGPRKPPLVGYAPVSGLVEFPEMAVLMKTANRSGSSLLERLIELYDNRTEVTHSSRGTGITRAKNPFCSVLTTSQPKALRQILTTTDADSGFLNRWIFVSGNKKPRRVITLAHADIGPAVTELQRIRGWISLRHLAVGFDAENDDAYHLFERFIEEKVWPIVENDETGFYNRLELLYKKIILLLAMNEKTQIITTEMVKKLYILHEYLVKTLEIPGKHVGTFETNDLAEKILEKVKYLTKEITNGPTKILKGPSAREIFKYLGTKPEVTLFHRILDMLERGGVIEAKAVPGKRGPATVRYLAVGE